MQCSAGPTALRACPLHCVQYKRSQIRKGMVLVDSALNPKSCWEFEGDILVLHHPTTISCKYQAMGEQRGGAMGGPHCRGGGAMGERGRGNRLASP